MKISKALVFDIKRFAIHDGEGIRTTVFFKGCPLRCLWCQNPEGLSPYQQVLYLESKCIHCQRCRKVAYENQLTYNKRPYINRHFLGNNDNIIEVCPSNALTYDSQEYTIEELVQKLKEDQVFFQDNGGVTLSGGEPFLQGQFIIELLKRLKEENIHTMIETSLYTQTDLLKQALPYLDGLYVDLKIFDDTKHKAYTGVSNQLILKNFQYLLTSSHASKVIVRTPLIPHKTATIQNIKEISKYISSLYPDVRYELLNYNPLASSKYSLLDEQYPLEDYPLYRSNQLEEFYQIAKQNGIKNLIIE